MEYTYDPLGRRIARRAYDDEDTLLSTEKYLWNGLTELLAVYDGSNQLQQRFDYLGGGLPVGVEIWDGTGFDYYYLAYDQIGSLRYVFDEAGSVAKAVTYDAFGNVLSDSNPSLRLPLGFAGGHTDLDTGLVRFVARDYDPEIGRWTAGDPIGIQGGLNASLYVRNNPVNATDPYGLAPNWGDRIAAVALSHNNSTDWAFDAFNWPFERGTNKCNVFVADCIREAGALIPKYHLTGPGFLNVFPGDALAGEWTNSEFDIPGWDIVHTPRAGDVVAKSHGSGATAGQTGHVGLVIGEGEKLRTISASAELVREAELVAGYGDKAVFRRYNHEKAVAVATQKLNDVERWVRIQR